jgi:hypothetical protein
VAGEGGPGDGGALANAPAAGLQAAGQFSERPDAASDNFVAINLPSNALADLEGEFLANFVRYGHLPFGGDFGYGITHMNATYHDNISLRKDYILTMATGNSPEAKLRYLYFHTYLPRTSCICGFQLAFCPGCARIFGVGEEAKSREFGLGRSLKIYIQARGFKLGRRAADR